MKKNILFLYFLFITLFANPIFSQPSKKKARYEKKTSHQSSGLLKIPELSTMTRYLGTDHSSFDLTCKTLYSEKSSHWSLLQINTHFFIQSLNYLSSLIQQPHLNKHQKKHIQRSLKNPVTVEEFLQLIPQNIKPIFDTPHPHERSMNWEALLIKIAEHQTPNNKYIFDTILSSMLNQNLYNQLQESHFTPQFSSHVISKIFFPYLYHKIFHQKNNTTLNPESSINDKSLTILIQSLNSVITNTDISSKIQNLPKNTISPLEEKIKKISYWGQSSIPQSYAHTLAFMVQAPQTHDIQHIALIASETIFNFYYSLENEHSNRVQTTLNQMSDTVRGIRNENFSWDNLPTVIEPYPGLQTLNNNLLTVLQHLDQKFKFLNSEDQHHMTNDILNIIYEFDMFEVNQVEDIEQEIKAFNNYLRSIYYIITYQPVENIKQSIKNLKEIIFFIQYLVDTQNNDDFLHTIEQYILEISAQYNFNKIQDCIKKYEHFSRVAYVEDLDLSHMILNFFGHSPELFQTELFLQKAIQTIDPEELEACLTSQNLETFQWELPCLIDPTYQAHTHHLFKTTLQSSFQTDQPLTHKQRSFLYQHQRNRFLGSHISAFIFSNQLVTLQQQDSLDNPYLESEPHIPIQLEDLIDGRR